MIALESREQFIRLIDDLAATIIDAQWHWRMQEDLLRALDAVPSVRNQSPVFWSLTIDAHRLTAIHALCRAYDQDQRGLHLTSWLRTIQENLFEPFIGKAAGVFLDSLAMGYALPDQQQLEDDMARCCPDESLVMRLTILRAEGLAHRNAKHARDRTSAKTELQLQLEDVQPLITRADEILNRYAIMFTGVSRSSWLVGRDDYQTVIDAVRDDLKHRHDDELVLIKRLGLDKAGNAS